MPNGETVYTLEIWPGYIEGKNSVESLSYTTGKMDVLSGRTVEHSGETVENGDLAFAVYQYRVTTYLAWRTEVSGAVRGDDHTGCRGYGPESEDVRINQQAGAEKNFPKERPSRLERGNSFCPRPSIIIRDNLQIHPLTFTLHKRLHKFRLLPPDGFIPCDILPVPVPCYIPAFRIIALSAPADTLPSAPYCEVSYTFLFFPALFADFCRLLFIQHRHIHDTALLLNTA